RLWKASGGETVAATIALAVLFFLAAVGVTVGAVGLLRSASQAALAGILLVAAPTYLVDATAQCADLPLGYFLLTTVVLVVVASRSVPANPRLLALPGLAARPAARAKDAGPPVAGPHPRGGRRRDRRPGRMAGRPRLSLRRARRARADAARADRLQDARSAERAGGFRAHGCPPATARGSVAHDPHRADVGEQMVALGGWS